MKRTDIRAIIWETTTQLVNENQLFSAEGRAVFTQRHQIIADAFQGNSGNANQKVRRSNRIPNLSARLEDLYETHLEKGTQDGLEKKFVDEKIGWGLYATKVFHDKQFIIEYKGILLSQAEGQYMYENLPEEDGSYLFSLGKAHNNQWVDATGNKEALGRYVNHSRHAYNSKVICRTVEGKPRIFLIATRTIQIGEQLLYDYNDRNKNFPFLYK